MRKALIGAVAFIASAILGSLLLLLITATIGYLWMVFFYRHQTGIGAVAGGLSGVAVLLVPILCGVIGTLITLHRFDRKQS
jgi:hypothetical protein